jgi:hypothetical protein
MKSISRIIRPAIFPLAIIAGLALIPASCGKREEPAAAAAAPPAAAVPAAGLAEAATGASPFAKVLARLDSGGKMLHIQDHEGRREVILGVARIFLSTVLADMPSDDLDLPALVDACGLARTAASGRSLRKDGDAWLLRAFSYLPQGRRGPAELLGDEAAAFKAPQLLPGSVDLVIESRLALNALPGIIANVAAACGLAEAAKDLLEQEAAPGVSMRDLLAKSDLHVVAGLDVSSWAKAGAGGRLDFFVRIDGAKDLLAAMLPQLEANFGEAQAIGGRRMWELPPASEGQAPALMLADEPGTLTLASTKDYLEAAEGGQGKLAADPDFLAATDHFPKAGNLLVYASRELPPLLAGMLRQVEAPPGQEEAAAMLAEAAGHLAPRTWSFCLAHEMDGTVATGEMPFPLETDLAATLPLMSATSIVFIGARSWKQGSDRAGCILNIRNVQTAVRSHQGMNELNFGAPLPWDEIIGPDGFLTARPVCPAGGTYTLSQTVPAIGTPACTCSHEGHAPADTDGW